MLFIDDSHVVEDFDTNCAFGSIASRVKEGGECVTLGGEKNSMHIGHSSLQGYRTSNEDAHLITGAPFLENSHVLMAIFDGHAGKGTSAFAREHLAETLSETKGYKNYVKSKANKVHETDTDEEVRMIRSGLSDAFIALDKKLLDLQMKGGGDGSGSTCSCAVVSPSHIYSAWVGDSRCNVGIANGGTLAMTDDHKPENKAEMRRIMRADGFVLDNRVDGQLAMSRALGDFQYKLNKSIPLDEQKVTCIPDIIVRRRQDGDDLVLLCCDGVFDVLSNEESVDFVRDSLRKEQETQNKQHNAEGIRTPEIVAERLIDHALDTGSYDNISAIVCVIGKAGGKKGKRE